MRAAVLAVVLAISCVCLAGCGGAGTAAAGSSPTTGSYEVKLSDVPGVGRILVDGSGYALYAYVPDHRGASQCSGGCALDWPPLVLPRGVRRPVAGAGIRIELLGTTRRSDGALQVTYDRWPLYLYKNDRAPDEASGQGDDMGLWYVLTAGGSLDRRPDLRAGS